MTCEHNFLGESTCEHCGAGEVDTLRAELAAIRDRITEIADDALGLQVSGTQPVAMLDALETAFHEERIRASNAERERDDEAARRMALQGVLSLIDDPHKMVECAEANGACADCGNRPCSGDCNVTKLAALLVGRGKSGTPRICSPLTAREVLARIEAEASPAGVVTGDDLGGVFTAHDADPDRRRRATIGAGAQAEQDRVLAIVRAPDECEAPCCGATRDLIARQLLGQHGPYDPEVTITHCTCPNVTAGHPPRVIGKNPDPKCPIHFPGNAGR